MISEPDYENIRSLKRDRTVQVWSFGAAVPLAVLIWMLLAANLLALRLHGVGEIQKPEEIVELNSSTIQIRPPIPRNVPVQRRAPAPTAPKPQPERAQQQAVAQHPQAQPTELAHIVPHAPPQPRSGPQHTQATLAEQLAQQEVAFAHEAQRINNSHGITVSTPVPNEDTNDNTYKMPNAGNFYVQGHGDGIIRPVQSWFYQGKDCYYARYEWTYPSGGTEAAVIPWAICFDPRHDLFAEHVREIPIVDTYPQPGYRLPAGTPLTPIEKMVYNEWLGNQ